MTLSVPTLTAVGGESAVQLSWTTVSGAVRYELWTWTSAGGFQQLDDGALTGTTYSHTGLTEGTTYYYWVRAVNGSGEMSAWSQRTSATVAAAPSIVVPTATSTPTSTVSSLSKPVLTAEAGESAVQLTWTAVTGAERYVLMAWTSADGWQQIGGGQSDKHELQPYGADGRNHLLLRCPRSKRSRPEQPILAISNRGGPGGTGV